MKLQNLIRSFPAFLNAIMLLVSIFSLFAGHSGIAAIVGGNSFLNYLILFKTPNTAHPGRTKGIIILSILGNLCLVFIGTALLHINKGPVSLWGGYWLILTALFGFYFAIRQWRAKPPKTDKSIAPEQKTAPTEKQYATPAPTQKTDISQFSLQPKTWKTYLFGSENPTGKSSAGTLGLYLFLGLCFYTMAKPTFFPSDIWKNLGNQLILIPTAASLFFIFKVFRKQGLNPYIKNGRQQSPLLMLFLPLMVWAFFKIAFVLGLGHAYTQIYGQETSMVVPAVKTKITHSYKYSTNKTYCIKSDKLNMGLMSEICISKERFDSVPENFMMTLVGKQSYFGFVFNKYGLHNPEREQTSEYTGSVYAQAEYYLGLRYAQGKGLSKDYAEAAKHFRLSAEQGNAQAQFLLGGLYASGIGVEKNAREAADWLKKAAKQDNKDAQRQLGLMYMKGVGVDNDPALAEKWIRAAADQGDAKAQFIMSALLIKKEPKNHQEIQNWLKKSAEQGITEAQASLGMLYLFEDPPKLRDPVEAVKWLRLAADKGDATAQEKLAALYINGDGIAKDPVEAAKLFLKAADQDREKSQFVIGLLYASGQGVQKDMTEAEKWFRKAAEKGNAEAQYLLGGIYAQGDGVVQDYAESVKWLRLSANQGNAKAQNNLAYAYEKGHGVTQDFAESLKWCQKAADQGLPIAISGMGDFYRLGEGVPQDYIEAEKWYRKAAEYGSPEGQFHLGQFYADGTGITKNYEEAYFWLTLSTNAGSKDAPLARDEAAAHLSEQQISDIQKRVADWNATKPQSTAPPATGIP